MRLTATSHLTLDGVMQSNGKPEPELNDGFEQGGWQVPYFGPDLDDLTGGWIAAADAFLLGRRTYQLLADYWVAGHRPRRSAGDPVERAAQVCRLHQPGPGGVDQLGSGAVDVGEAVIPGQFADCELGAGLAP